MRQLRVHVVSVELTTIAMIVAFMGCSHGELPVAGTPSAEETPSRIDAPSSGGLLEGLDEVPATTHDVAAPLENAIRFEDVHHAAGIDFVFDTGASQGRHLMPEATSGGGAWLDYDADGWPDLLFVQGGRFTENGAAEGAGDQLYRNLGNGRFRLVTEFSGIADSVYGHGASVGDFNGDGFDDFYVSNVGEDALYLNLGDGTFEEITAEAGISNPRWASSAAWGDLNGDNLLDLYVCNYVDYDPYDPIACFDADGNPGTCHPRDVDDVPNVCFINQGDGTFTEEADRRGLNGPGSKSLGVVIADFNGNRQMDVYVANDTTANHLFINQGDGRFSEQGLTLGCSMSGLGQFQASMGVAFGDYDRNGWPDLYVTHFTMDSNTLYRNIGDAAFTDVTREVHLHQPTLRMLGFGTVMADFNADGWQDLFVANGHIDDWRDVNGDAWHMQPQMFRFDGRRWHDVSRQSGQYFERELLGRAVASADYDRDGDLDLMVIHQEDTAGLLRNDSDGGHWLQLRLVGTDSNRQGIGARVTVKQADRVLVSQLAGGTSYCTSHQAIIHFGLGESAEACQVQVQWPGGLHQTWNDLPADSILTLIENESQAR
ncbi:MAG: CRTAC1 family protein [Maioricimonas sp. JB049]